MRFGLDNLETPLKKRKKITKMLAFFMKGMKKF